MPRRFQFSLRVLLVAMLVLAVSIWAFILQRRSAEFRDHAEYARQVARYFSVSADPNAVQFYELTSRGWQGTSPSSEQKAQNDRWIQYYRESFAYYDKLRLKYEKAARCPWLPVDPDQPPPEAGQFAVDEWLEQVMTWPDSAVAIEQ